MKNTPTPKKRGKRIIIESGELFKATLDSFKVFNRLSSLCRIHLSSSQRAMLAAKIEKVATNG